MTMEGTPMSEAPLADREKLKREQREAWNDAAAGWQKWWPTFERAAQRVSDRLVELAAIKPGDRVLDIATGNGEPAVTAARKVGASGHVVGVDQSPGMLRIARERAAAIGLSNVEFVESDAERLALPERSFDAVICRWGLMFMPDLDATLKRLHALTKPGGGFATAVWSSRDKVPLISSGADVIRKIGNLPPPPPGALEPCRLADTSILSAALTAAGYKQIHVEPLIVRFEFESPETAARFRSEVAGARAMLEQLDAATRERARDAMMQVARSFADAAGVVRFDNEAILFGARA
jgi:ubiquinone/menaquinone biosynthesis C-methylase UbiE